VASLPVIIGMLPMALGAKAANSMRRSRGGDPQKAAGTDIKQGAVSTIGVLSNRATLDF
jgi:hypothetical protein